MLEENNVCYKKDLACLLNRLLSSEILDELWEDMLDQLYPTPEMRWNGGQNITSTTTSVN